MANWFNFLKVTPPIPNDPNVDEENYIAYNFRHLDDQLSPYNEGQLFLPAEVGQEYINAADRFTVWDGTSGRVPDSIGAAWSSWTNLPILSPRAIRTGGFTPKWRNNSLLRMVEMSGGVQFDSAANVWPTGGLYTINADTTGAIPASMQPIGGVHVSQCAAALTAGTSIVSGGYAYIDKPAGNTFTRIRLQYMGGPGGGNFIMMDQIWWWY